MLCKEFEVPCGYGVICGQVFNSSESTEGKKAIISIHGYLDNANSFKPLAESMLRESSDYYIISIDMPGMGFSTKLPHGIPYSPKLYQLTVRRVVKHFQLTRFIFMCHSAGCSHPLIYSSCFKDEVESIIMLDFAMMDLKFDRKPDMSVCWKDYMDTYLNAEKELQDKEASKKLAASVGEPSSGEQLTLEHALKRLLHDNKFIDEKAARVLLERGLRTNADTQALEYTRDIRFVIGMSSKDYHAEFGTQWESVFAKLRAPMLFVYASNPFPYGQGFFNEVSKLVDALAQGTEVQREPIDSGSHHFHMMKPDETARVVLDFLNKKNNKTDSNNNTATVS